MSTTEIIVVIAAAVAISPLVSVIVAIIVARRNKDKDIRREAQEYGEMRSDLAYIKQGIDDLKKNQTKHDEKLDDLTERVATVETKLDAHVNNKTIHSTRVAKVPSKK